MKDIYIFGASGYAREVALLINELNEFSIKGFVDKENSNSEIILNNNSYSIISEKQFINICKNNKTNAAIAIANPLITINIINKFDNICSFPNIIHPNTIFSGKSILGKGNIISYNCIFTDNIKIGSFNRFNIGVLVGHDVTIGNNNQFNTSCNISGNVKIENNNLFGVNSVILQNIQICDDNLIGASSLVIKNIKKSGTYIGNPAVKLKY